MIIYGKPFSRSLFVLSPSRPHSVFFLWPQKPIMKQIINHFSLAQTPGVQARGLLAASDSLTRQVVLDIPTETECGGGG